MWSSRALLLVVVGCGRIGFAPGAGDRGGDGGGGNDPDALTISGDAAVPGVNVNVAFVTAADVIPGALGAIAGADARCQADADAAGLPGQYVAWLSDTTTNAIDRLAVARGWVRPDGLPVTDTAAELAARGPFVPISVMADGTDLTSVTAVDVVTASTNAGYPTSSNTSGTCMDWTSTTDDVLVGAAQSTNDWSHVSLGLTGPCSAPHRLYCFGTGLSTAVAPSAIAGQRRAFLTATSIMPGSGIASFDALCQADADAAGLGGSFRALVATTTASAASRFDATGATWVRIDGVPLAPTAADLLATGFRTSLNQLANGTYRRALVATVFTGATTITAVGSESCMSWDTAIASMDARAGSYHFAGARALDQQLAACNLNRPLYCLEE